MNEQIKTLAIECYNPYGEFEYEKFAKLVVEQCLEFIEKDAANAPDGGEAQVALLACALDILDHFDIELND